MTLEDLGHHQAVVMQQRQLGAAIANRGALPSSEPAVLGAANRAPGLPVPSSSRRDRDRYRTFVLFHGTAELGHHHDDGGAPQPTRDQIGKARGGRILPVCDPRSNTASTGWIGAENDRVIYTRAPRDKTYRRKSWASDAERDLWVVCCQLSVRIGSRRCQVVARRDH
jgi:hypothetical protein